MIVEVSEQEKKQARHPHEYFLINLITNHILMFVGLLGMARDKPSLMLIVPLVSVSILVYLVIRARVSLKRDSWYVMCHWQLCARRSRFFIAMLLLLLLVIVALVLTVGGDVNALKPGHYAAGGVAILPTMLSVLVLIIMESDAVHKANIGEVPDWLVKKYPDPSAASGPPPA